MLDYIVLIVDPDSVLRDELGVNLRKYYRVLSAADIKEALQLLELFSVDLIVTEWKFGNNDAFEFIQTVKKEDKFWRFNSKDTRPVLILSEVVDLLNVIAAKKTGADDFVPKPYDWIDLLSKIQRLLKK